MVLFLDETSLINQDWRNSIVYNLPSNGSNKQKMCMFIISGAYYSCQVLRFEILQIEEKKDESF